MVCVEEDEFIQKAESIVCPWPRVDAEHPSVLLDGMLIQVWLISEQRPCRRKGRHLFACVCVGWHRGRAYCHALVCAVRCCGHMSWSATHRSQRVRIILGCGACA